MIKEVIPVDKKNIDLFLLSGIIVLFIFSFNSCNDDSPTKYDPPIIPPIGGMPAPYQDVSVSPDGQKLIFFRTKYTYVSKDGLNIQYDPDSTGIWICNIDGSEMKLIYKNNKDFIGRPQFIPNSNYILFNLNNQIVKAVYNGNLIDNSDIQFLTTAGNNFFPSVNFDGSLITYDSNNESPNGMNFIWIMNVDGSKKIRIAYDPTKGEIRMPYFSPTSGKIVHIRWLVGVQFCEIYIMKNAGDSTMRITYNSYEDYEPRLNYLENRFILLRNGSLITRQLNSNNETVLIQKSAQSAIWNADNKIIFVWLLGYYQNNGTVWIMNEDGSDKNQITYNYGLVLEGGG